MLSKSQLRTRLEFIGLVMATSSIVGMIIAASVTDGPLTALVLVMGAAQGVVIGLGCSGSEVLILSNPSLRLARRFPPLVIVLLRALLYSAAILLGLSLPGLVMDVPRPWDEPNFAWVFAMSITVAGGFAFLTETLRLLGIEAAQSLLSGRYHRPRLEERVVLVADIAGSTELGETLGELRFHSFLADVAQELSPAIDRTGGAVHRYVGDAVFVTWPHRHGDEAVRALDCARRMHHALARRDRAYQKAYFHSPRLRVAIHRGVLAAGVIGDWKKEIALLGDTMNTAARIETAAGKMDEAIVLSDAAAQALPDPLRADLRSLPPYEAAGKRAPLVLWAASVT